MTNVVRSTFSLRSEIRADATLELSLQSVELPAPGPDQIVVELEAAPLHPADISQLLGPADLSSGVRTGTGMDAKMVFQIPGDGMASVARRVGRSLPVGNEGAGLVVAAGGEHIGLLGRTVAIMGGAMLSRLRMVNVSNVLLLPNGMTAARGAAALINPLTALAMIQTMREEGHTALVHTAAASSLGQMLNRVCIRDGVPLVNIVRRPEQASLLASQGATLVCDSSNANFARDLDVAIARSGATLAFDALGGGTLASQMLSSMERACSAGTEEYRRYGSRTQKTVYFYGGLDARPTELDRSYGMAWGVGGWLLFDKLDRMDAGALATLKSQIAFELNSTFSTEFAAEISLTDVMRSECLEKIAKRKTGEKFLVNPQRTLD